LSASPHDISPGPSATADGFPASGSSLTRPLSGDPRYSGQAHLSWKAPKRRDRPSYRRESGGLCMTSGGPHPGRRVSLKSQRFRRPTFREDMNQPVCGGEIVRDACGFLREKVARNSANRCLFGANFSANHRTTADSPLLSWFVLVCPCFKSALKCLWVRPRLAVWPRYDNSVVAFLDAIGILTIRP